MLRSFLHNMRFCILQSGHNVGGGISSFFPLKIGETFA